MKKAKRVSTEEAWETFADLLPPGTKVACVIEDGGHTYTRHLNSKQYESLGLLGFAVVDMKRQILECGFVDINERKPKRTKRKG